MEYKSDKRRIIRNMQYTIEELLQNKHEIIIKMPNKNKIPILQEKSFEKIIHLIPQEDYKVYDLFNFLFDPTDYLITKFFIRTDKNKRIKKEYFSFEEEMADKRRISNEEKKRSESKELKSKLNRKDKDLDKERSTAISKKLVPLEDIIYDLKDERIRTYKRKVPQIKEENRRKLPKRKVEYFDGPSSLDEILNDKDIENIKGFYNPIIKPKNFIPEHKIEKVPILSMEEIIGNNDPDEDIIIFYREHKKDSDEDLEIDSNILLNPLAKLLAVSPNEEIKNYYVPINKDI